MGLAWEFYARLTVWTASSAWLFDAEQGGLGCIYRISVNESGQFVLIGSDIALFIHGGKAVPYDQRYPSLESAKERCMENESRMASYHNPVGR
jgi:hypothetical protein